MARVISKVNKRTGAGWPSAVGCRSPPIWHLAWGRLQKVWSGRISHTVDTGICGGQDTDCKEITGLDRQRSHPRICPHTVRANMGVVTLPTVVESKETVKSATLVLFWYTSRHMHCRMSAGQMRRGRLRLACICRGQVTGNMQTHRAR